MTRVVLKLGGRVAAGVAAQALDLAADGHEVVVVHGAGPQISEELGRRGLPVEFRNGLRVTSAEAIEVVREALRAVQADVCAALGAPALPLWGDEIGLRARPLPGLGLVGEPLPCCPPAVVDGLGNGRIPVVAPLAVGPLNVNADDAASALAVGLGADRLLFVSDVPGVYVEGALAVRLDAEEADALLSEGAFEGGIVPKLLAAVRAARLGVRTEIGETEVLAPEAAA